MIHREKTNYKEWYNEGQQMTASDSKLKRVATIDNDLSTTMHPKENSLNTEYDLEKRLLN